jgi:long-subunit acyl-CoA synthetase (AMP-forming)
MRLGPQEIQARVNAVAESLARHVEDGMSVGLLADNSIDWVIVDLACQLLRLTVVPIPGFFTPQQIQHLIQSQHIAVMIAESSRPQNFLVDWRAHSMGDALTSLRLYCNRHSDERSYPVQDYQKLTFTSGTTAAPKGIPLSKTDQWQVADALRQTLGSLEMRRHLCLLPLSVLLENLAGVYAGLVMGAEIVIVPLSETGLLGASGFDAGRAIGLINRVCAHSVILLPQMLKEIVHHLEQNRLQLSSLKFVAVGGGKVSPALIQQARRLGLPVYEGYGLSEASSVVALNIPGRDRLGSVGFPLPHVRIQIAADAEILVLRSAVRAERNSDDTGWSERVISTGDLGYIDSDGFLVVTGRKKNVLITGFGRNVSPEWPEALLTADHAIAQSFVYGEGDAQLSAIIVPADRSDLPESVIFESVRKAVYHVNQGLPDYARIKNWHVTHQRFSLANGFLTANGRLRRNEILERHEIFNTRRTP